MVVSLLSQHQTKMILFSTLWKLSIFDSNELPIFDFMRKSIIEEDYSKHEKTVQKYNQTSHFEIRRLQDLFR